MTVNHYSQKILFLKYTNDFFITNFAFSPPIASEFLIE